MKAQKVTVINEDGTFLKEFQSITDLADHCGIHPDRLRRKLRKKRFVSYEEYLKIKGATYVPSWFVNRIHHG